MAYGPSPLPPEFAAYCKHDEQPTQVYFDPKLGITIREEALIKRFMEDHDMMNIHFLQYMYRPEIEPYATHHFNGFGHHMHFRMKNDYLLIHETVHALQYSSGIMWDCALGIMYRDQLYQELDGPWEEEAFKIAKEYS